MVPGTWASAALDSMNVDVLLQFLKKVQVPIRKCPTALGV